MKRIYLLLTMLALCYGAYSQDSPVGGQERTVTFRFVLDKDMFYIPWQGNDTELNTLYDLIDEYRTQITSGAMPVYVDGYSPTKQLSFIRANRVKSELILHRGMTEDHFITKNYSTAYTAPNGTIYKDMVVVTIRIPSPDKPEPETQPEPRPEPKEEPEPVEEKPFTAVEPQPAPDPVPTASRWYNEPYRLAVRTNLLYDGFGLPTFGIEYRINRHVGIKLDGSRSWWSGDDNGKVQKIWLVSPEVRWYLLENKRFYVGASASFGEYNTYKYPVGGLFSSDTGYQGKLWSTGATVGYQLYLCRSFSFDFNVGLGYTHSKYDSFTIEDGQRLYKDRDKTRTLWGPTQAGISLVWTIGSERTK